LATAGTTNAEKDFGLVVTGRATREQLEAVAIPVGLEIA